MARLPLLGRRSVRKAGPALPAGAQVVADLTGMATMLQGGTGFGTNATSPPEQTVQALREQGMQSGQTFSPGQPIQQFFPWGSPPWAWDRPTGYNIATRPRATESRVSFETLKSIYETYDIARLCVEHRQDDIRALDWHITPMDGHTSSDVDAAIEAATNAMAKPDGRTPFDSWQNAFLEDVLKYDAGCLHRARLRNGKVAALEVVSGRTIAPLLDYRGQSPTGEAPAFVQFVSGVPSVWLLERDLVYRPFRAQSDSPYGLAPMEYLLLNANTDLRFQWHFLQYFTEGTLPEAFMEAPPDSSSPDQLMEFQAAWDSVMEGDQAQKRKVRWIPAGSKPTFSKDEAFSPEFPMYLLRKTAAAHKVKPTEIGFTDNANRSTSDVQDDVQRRVGRKPLMTYLEGIYTSFLRDDLGLPVTFSFDAGEEKEDRLQAAQEWKVWIEAGVVSPDEPREKVLGLPVDPKQPIPRFVVSRNGIEPLKSIVAIAGKDVDPETMAPKPGSVDFIEDAPEPAVVADDPTKVTSGGVVDEPAPETASAPKAPEPAKPVAKADADIAPTQAMVALMLPADAAAALAVDDGVPAADMHLTLASLGSSLTAEQHTAAARALAAVASVWGPVEGVVNGTGTFAGDGCEVHVALYDSPGLGALREAVVDALLRAGVPVSTDHGFTPHISRSYGDDCPELDAASLPLAFAELTLAVGPLRVPYPLTGHETGVDPVALAKELRRWRDNARTRVRKGLAPRPFVSALLPPSVTADVWAALSEAGTREQVDSAFADLLRH